MSPRKPGSAGRQRPRRRVAALSCPLQPNSFYVGDAVDLLNTRCAPDSVALGLTSPPYDDLSLYYQGYSFDAEQMQAAIYRVAKPGGVHDVMIYQKKNTPFQRANAHTNFYELMIVFSKGRPTTFNPRKKLTKRSGWETAVSNKSPEAVNIKRPGHKNMRGYGIKD